MKAELSNDLDADVGPTPTRLMRAPKSTYTVTVTDLHWTHSPRRSAKYQGTLSVGCNLHRRDLSERAAQLSASSAATRSMK